MKIRREWIYVAVGVLAILSYITTRHYIITTPINNIVVSNLTVNYVLLSMIVGGTAGWLAWTKVRGRIRMPATAASILLSAGIFLAIVVAGGYELR